MSKQPWRRYLRIQHLCSWATNKDIKEFFSQERLQTKITEIKVTGGVLREAFITFTAQTHMLSALKLNGRSLLGKGVKLSLVNQSDVNSALEQNPLADDECNDGCKQLYVRLQNLPPGSTEGDIRKFLSEKGLDKDVDSVEVIGINRDGFLKFKTMTILSKALDLNGKCIFDQPVKVMMASQEEYDHVIQAAANCPSISDVQDKVSTVEAETKQTEKNKPSLLRIENIPREVVDSDIRLFLSKNNLHDNVYSIEIFKADHIEAFITFPNGTETLKTLELNGKYLLGQPVKVSQAGESDLKLAQLGAIERKSNQEVGTKTEPNTEGTSCQQITKQPTNIESKLHEQSLLEDAHIVDKNNAKLKGILKKRSHQEADNLSCDKSPPVSGQSKEHSLSCKLKEILCEEKESELTTNEMVEKTMNILEAESDKIVPGPVPSQRSNKRRYSYDSGRDTRGPKLMPDYSSKTNHGRAKYKVFNSHRQISSDEDEYSDEEFRKSGNAKLLGGSYAVVNDIADTVTAGDLRDFFNEFPIEEGGIVMKRRPDSINVTAYVKFINANHAKKAERFGATIFHGQRVTIKTISQTLYEYHASDLSDRCDTSPISPSTSIHSSWSSPSVPQWMYNRTVNPFPHQRPPAEPIWQRNSYRPGNPVPSQWNCQSLVNLHQSPISATQASPPQPQNRSRNESVPRIDGVAVGRSEYPHGYHPKTSCPYMSIFGAAEGILYQDQFLELHELPLNVTACEVWKWFGGPKGNVLGVTLIQSRDKNCILPKAFLAFRSERDCEEAFEATNLLCTIVSSSDLNSSFVNIEQFVHVCVSTLSGVDRFLTIEEKSILNKDIHPNSLDFQFWNSKGFVKLETLTVPTTASKCWKIFRNDKSAKSPGVLLVQNTQNVPRFAYVAVNNTDMSDAVHYQSIHPGVSRGTIITDLTFVLRDTPDEYKLLMSTDDGHDRLISKPERMFLTRYLLAGGKTQSSRSEKPTTVKEPSDESIEEKTNPLPESSKEAKVKSSSVKAKRTSGWPKKRAPYIPPFKRKTQVVGGMDTTDGDIETEDCAITGSLIMGNSEPQKKKKIILNLKDK